MSNEKRLEKLGFPYLWNDDRAIKDIEKATWLDTAFPDAKDKDDFIRRMHDLENRRTIPTEGQRKNMITYVGELLNNPGIPNDFKQSLQTTNKNLTDIQNAKGNLTKYLNSEAYSEDQKKAKLREYNQKTRYLNEYPDNAFVRGADTLDRWGGILGKHKDKPTTITSTSPDTPDVTSFKNMLLNAANKVGRAVGESTLGAFTDATRKLGGAPLQHAKAIVNGTVPMLAGVAASLFWPNEYFKKLADAKQGVLNQNNPLGSFKRSYKPADENALLSRYKKVVDPILDYRIPDIRKNGYYGDKPVTMRNLVNGTPLLESFKENIMPFLEAKDKFLTDNNIPEDERYKYFTKQMSPEEIQNFILRDILGYRSAAENTEAIENYIKSKGLDDETAEALRNLETQYAENFNSDINLFPPLIRELPNGGFDVSSFYKNYNEYVKASKNKGSAFTEGLGEGGIVGAGLGAITGAMTGKGILGRAKSAVGHAFSGGAVGGLTSGTIDATRAAFFTDDALPYLYPKETYTSKPFREYLVNTGNMNALPKVTNPNIYNPEQSPWNERLGWKEPPKPEAPKATEAPKVEEFDPDDI